MSVVSIYACDRVFMSVCVGWVCVCDISTSRLRTRLAKRFYHFLLTQIFMHHLILWNTTMSFYASRPFYFIFSLINNFFPSEYCLNITHFLVLLNEYYYFFCLKNKESKSSTKSKYLSMTLKTFLLVVGLHESTPRSWEKVCVCVQADCRLWEKQNVGWR